MPIRPASLLVAASLMALALAPPAQAKRHYLRFEVVSVKGQQTATWNDSQAYGDCGTISRSGSQTISFELVRPGRLRLLRSPRYTRTGKWHGFTYYGTNFVRTNWTFSRTFQQSPPPSCPPSADPYAAQATDCGTKGPFAVPVDLAWRGGALELRGVLARGAPGQRSPHYETCEYDGFHELDLIDSKGRLSQRRLTSRRRRTIRVKVSARLKEPAAESEGSQTTTLAATVTLRRVR